MIRRWVPAGAPRAVVASVLRGLEQLASLGTGGYATEDQRRLKILNLVSYLIVVTTGGYAVQHALMDYETYKPIIWINFSLLLVALSIPFLHRFGPITGALVLVACEYVALLGLTAFLGRNSGVHLQYFIAAAAAFVVLGLARLSLILAITAGGLVLHLTAWFMFPSDLAIVAAEQEVLDGIYTQAAVTTAALIAATVWYAFSLVERARAETIELLHKILPASIVERMHARPAEPIADQFEDASVLFADIVGFVPMSRELGPARVVALLNEIVTEFDRVVAARGIEKIKTIGDAYMAAGGVPQPSPGHLERIVDSALDMLAIVDRIRLRTGLPIRLRIGIAAGPVMSGVVGNSKFSYDVWGDTVNMASRLEGRSEPGRIMVCPTCQPRLAASFDLEPRGAIEIKGIGERETWLIVGRKVAREIEVRQLETVASSAATTA